MPPSKSPALESSAGVRAVRGRLSSYSRIALISAALLLVAPPVAAQSAPILAQAAKKDDKKDKAKTSAAAKRAKRLANAAAKRKAAREKAKEKAEAKKKTAKKDEDKKKDEDDAKTAPKTAAAPKDDDSQREPPGAKGPLPTTMDTIAEAVQAPYRPKPGGHLVKFNLEDADLSELVNHISGLTGKRFIYGAKVRQVKVTVVAPEAVTLNEAYEAFLSILEANGMTVVPHGRFLKIVDSGGVVTKSPPIYSRGAPVPDSDRYVTRLYRLQNVDADEVSKLLTKFKSKEGDISVYAPGSLLIITDSGTNIRRMIRIIEEIDVGGASTRMWLEPIHYGSAVDISKQINDIFDLSKGGGDGLTRVLADEQTNALIIVGTEDAYLRLLELLRRIDVAPAAEGKVQVLPLQHAVAEELASTLTQMLAGAAPKGKGKSAASGGNAGGQFEGEVRVTADKATNSLVVTSSAHDYAQLRLVIEKLDQKRRQVFIEAVIMDMSVERGSQFGIGFHGGATAAIGSDEESLIVGGFNPARSIAPGPAELSAAALGVRGPELDGTQNLPGLPAGVSIPAFGVFLNALVQSGDSNVLSTPHIIATDNVQAEINVGKNIPLQTNLAGGLGNLANLAQGAGGGGANALSGLGALGGFGFNAPRQDVGTKIKITPHINIENQVRLEIEEEISEEGATVGTLGAVSITQRSARTTVVVDDQQTVVIGGLMRESESETADKVPLLGDLPVLGFLFRTTEKRKSKSNLMLILTPYVIEDQGDLRKVFERKMQERQEFIDRYFIFTSEWEPPRDYSRTNGLVEEIRQSFKDVAEQARLRAELEPTEEKTHEPSEPIELPMELKSPGRSAPKKSKPKRPARKSKKRGDAAPIQINPVARSIEPETNSAAPIVEVQRIE